VTMTLIKLELLIESDKDPEQVAAHAQALLDHGSIRDAFGTAGLPLDAATVTDWANVPGSSDAADSHDSHDRPLRETDEDHLLGSYSEQAQADRDRNR